MKKIITSLLIIFLVACLPIQDTGKNNVTSDNEITEDITIPSEKEAELNEVEKNEDIVLKDVKDGIPVKTVIEGDFVSFPNLNAKDPDGDPIAYTFSSPLDKNGEWQTKVGDAGKYALTITASDGTNKAVQKLELIVKPKNAPPVIEISDSIEVNEGEKVILSPVITDPDNDELTITFSGFMDSEEYTTSFVDAGSHKVKITANDGENIVEKNLFIVVHNVNRPPVIDVITDVIITEGDKIIVTPTGTDPDNDKIKFSFSDPLDDAGKWTTEIGDAGRYEVTVSASDEKNKSSSIFEIIVEALNKPPVINIEDIVINEGETVKLNPVISDPEDDEFSTEYSGWMTTNIKTTGYDDAGTYSVTVIAKDSAGNTAKKDIVVTVKDVNRAPVFNPDAFI